MKWSFLYNPFVKLSLYNMNHLQSIPMDPKLSLIKGLHCMKNNDKTHVGILKK